ncbi:MAG: 8-amino-7-oxononanoate synthase [Mariniblastus sp.]|nr:8-amino-7-oxononanoate synthase [Mariniblastus sp.]
MARRTDWIDEQLDELERHGRLRHLQTRESPPVAGRVQLNGQSLINFGSNDYLGLAADERLVDAVKHYSGQLGWGSGASGLVSGRGTLHRRLEQELADFYRTEAALLFPTGFAANVGVVTSLVGRGDTVFSDQLNHASMIDGCRLSGATICVYRHNDMDHLSDLLESSPASGRRLIVTDALFSMDGDLALLKPIAQLADQHQAMFVVDEAHATGVLGADGRGASQQANIESDVDLRVGTLSKAFGSMGGYVAGSRQLIQWIYNRSRSYMFSTAQPEAISAASLVALEVIRSEPERRNRLLERAGQLRQKLQGIGLDVGNSSAQIIPIVLGDNQLAVSASQQLRDRGLFVPAIRPPAVPNRLARLRISLSSEHTEEHLDQLCESLSMLKQPG